MSSASSKPKSPSALRFPSPCSFRRQLQQRVDAQFLGPNGERKSKQGGRKILVKAGVILTWCVASYGYLLGFADGWLDATLAALSLAFAIAGIGFAIQHDGGHGSFSENPKLNALAAAGLDLIGGSSWIWKSKHNYLHHHFTNINGFDADLQDGSFMRLSPQQPQRDIHRWQHLYAWFLYALLPIKWHFFDDFLDLKHQRVGAQPITLNDPAKVRYLWLGKVIFFTWALVIPSMIHGFAITGLTYLFVSMVLGVLLAVVFQLAHCVDQAIFVPAPEDDASLPYPWVEHQLMTTVNFAHDHPFWTWYLGGLNYQIEHHLFPKVSHIHYPRLSSIVREACEEHNLPYHSYPTIGQAISSHYRFLKRLGRPNPAASASAVHSSI